MSKIWFKYIFPRELTFKNRLFRGPDEIFLNGIRGVDNTGRGPACPWLGPWMPD